MNPRYDKDIQVPCPKCRAIAGQPCKAPKGIVSRGIHAKAVCSARRNAALEHERREGGGEVIETTGEEVKN